MYYWFHRMCLPSFTLSVSKVCSDNNASRDIISFYKTTACLVITLVIIQIRLNATLIRSADTPS